MFHPSSVCFFFQSIAKSMARVSFIGVIPVKRVTVRDYLIVPSSFSNSLLIPTLDGSQLTNSAWLLYA